MKDRNLIYLDYNATTPVDPRVVAEVLPYFTDSFGNAASRSHPFGWQAEEAVKIARQRVSDLINVESREIIFTSGATESNNLALKGIYEMYHRSGNHIITVSTEHKAVLDTCEKIERTGGQITYLDVDTDGLVDLEQLESAITDKTILVSVMWANNETGVIQPMKEIGDICKRRGVLLMSDATQAVGKIEVDAKACGVHLMAFTGHKMYGPKGIGALYVCGANPRVKVSEQINGGGHERSMRSGTLNVPGIVGLGSACMIAQAEMTAEGDRLGLLRDRLESALLMIEQSSVNGSQQHRLPHVCNIAFKYIDGEGLMATFNQSIALASGSACTSASIDPSHVLLALGIGEDLAHSSIRFSLGRFTTDEEIDKAIALVTAGVAKMRVRNPVWEMYKDGIDVDGL